MILFSAESERFTMHYSLDPCPNPDDFNMHAHERYELFHFIRGKAVFWAEGTPYALEPGDVMLFNISEAHRVSVDPSQPYERLAVHFSGALLEGLDPEGALLTPFASRRLGEDNRLRPDQFKDDYWRTCVANMTARSENHALQMAVNLFPLLNEIRIAFANRSRNASEGGNPLPARIVNYVNDNLLGALTPDGIARAFYVSKSQLYAVFKQATGSSVWEYIIIKRLLRARQMLRSGASPSKAAAQCGFRDYTTFFRAYRRRFGCAPRQDAADFDRTVK